MEKRLRNVLIAGALVMSLALAVVLLPERARAEDQKNPNLIAAPDDPKSQRLISVVGEATIPVKPDMATVSFGVETNGATAKEAQQANASKLSAVIAALKKSGIKEEDIQTSNLSLHPVYEWKEDKPRPSAQTLSGYRCNNTVTVKVKAIDAVSGTIDTAVQAGATNVGGISFGLQNPEPKKTEALTMAVESARQKAAVLAKAAQVTVKGISRISDDWAGVDRGGEVSSSVKALGDVGTPIEAGTVTVRATVRIEFAF